MNCGHQLRNGKNSKVTPELIENTNEWIVNHPQVVNSPIYNDILLVPDTEQPGKKTSVSKMILQISIPDPQNDLISESIIYQL